MRDASPYRARRPTAQPLSAQGETVPIWVYIYCVVLIVTSMEKIRICKNMYAYYIPGEILSLGFGISIFLFHYEILPKPQSILITSAFVAYIIFWGFWANINYYIPNLPTREPGLSIYMRKKKYHFVFGFVLLMVFLSPLFYISTRVLLSYGT